MYKYKILNTITIIFQEFFGYNFYQYFTKKKKNEYVKNYKNVQKNLTCFEIHNNEKKQTMVITLSQ